VLEDKPGINDNVHDCTDSIKTGFSNLDELLVGMNSSDGGMLPSELIILAGRPSMGKTSFAMNLAYNCAISSGKPVGIFSLEMSKQTLVDHYFLGMGDAPIFIYAPKKLSIVDLRSQALFLKSENNIKFLVIDSLQFLENAVDIQKNMHVICELKKLATDLNIPILLTSHIRRIVDERINTIPNLLDVIHLGDVEKYASTIMFIARKDANGNIDPSGESSTIISSIELSTYRRYTIFLMFQKETHQYKEILRR
jgi:replicative DNA helicase